MTRTEKIINYIMAVFLLVVICLFGFMTVKGGWRDLYKSATRMKQLKAYLPEDPGILDNISARISSFDSTLNEKLWKKNELGYFNSSFQYALGKKVITTGSTKMLTLPTGDLYDLPVYEDLSGMTDEIIAFAGTLDVPFLFVYEHPTTYEGNRPTGGYEELDCGDRLSDEVTGAIAAAGIDMIDSRDVLNGLPVSEITLRTDQHWTTRAALIMTGAIARNMGIDDSLFDLEKFETKTYENKFLGKCGQKVGVQNVKPDDLTVFWPAYDTYITRETMNNGRETRAEGSFREAAIKWNRLEGDGVSKVAYMAYGLTENFEHYHNDSGADMTVLLFKDSYSSPIGAFLSLAVKDVYMVDMRKSDEKAEYYVEKYRPDYVVMAYCRQMLCDDAYDLMEDE